MSFLCPECATAGALKITSWLELPSDSRSDEITLQIVACSHCRFAAIAVYEESRRGSLSGESVDHRGYYVRGEDLRRLERLMARCPSPADHRCPCATHQRLGSSNAHGRWNGLADFKPGRRFVMQLS